MLVWRKKGTTDTHKLHGRRKEEEEEKKRNRE